VKKEEPWFWLVGQPSGMTPAEEIAWSVEHKIVLFTFSDIY
jgi:hypothetical protein